MWAGGMAAAAVTVAEVSPTCNARFGFHLRDDIARAFVSGEKSSFPEVPLRPDRCHNFALARPPAVVVHHAPHRTRVNEIKSSARVTLPDDALSWPKPEGLLGRETERA